MSKTSAAARKIGETADRRSSSRQTIILRIGVLAYAERSTFCVVKDISPTGAQLRLFGSVPADAAVALRVGDEDAVNGRIAWVRDMSAGIEFDDPIDATRLLRVMQKVAPVKRRSSPRVEAAARVLLRTGGRSYPAELADISAMGARVRALRPVRLGPSVMVTLPDLPTVKAFVRWTDETDLGLVFESPLPIQLIAEWMNQRVNVSG